MQTPVVVLEGSDMNVKVSISADIPLKNDKNVGVTLLTEPAIQDEDAIFKSTHKGMQVIIYRIAYALRQPPSAVL